MAASAYSKVCDPFGVLTDAVTVPADVSDAIDKFRDLGVLSGEGHAILGKHDH